VNDTTNHLLELSNMLVYLSLVEIDNKVMEITPTYANVQSITNATYRLMTAFPAITGIYFGSAQGLFAGNERLVRF
jgi:hypothetical protein